MVYNLIFCDVKAIITIIRIRSLKIESKYRKMGKSEGKMADIPEKRGRIIKSKCRNLEGSSISTDAEMPSVISPHELDQSCLTVSQKRNLCRRNLRAASSQARQRLRSATLYSLGCWNNRNHVK